MSTASPQNRRKVYDAGMNPNSISWLIAGIAGFTAVLMAAALLRGRSGRDDVYRNTLLQRISKQLDALDHIGKQVEGLDRAFRIPRIRGGFGETMLEELLRSWLPAGSWSAQYTFPDGARVDAVIRMGSRLVAVDSKFPLERVEAWLENDDAGMSGDIRRSVIGHAEAIASKYIRPDDGTLNFALMYLPAENLHYRLLRDDDGTVMRECLSRGVLPVGPMSLFVYLQTVSYGLRGLALPSEGRELRKRVDRLRRDFSALMKPLSTASTHLKNLVKSWDEIERRTLRMEDGLTALEDKEDN